MLAIGRRTLLPGQHRRPGDRVPHSPADSGTLRRMSTDDARAAILAYENAQKDEDRLILSHLRAEIDRALPDAEAKVWHGAPVWFLAGNPVVGTWVRKAHVQLLFWSGQSFEEPLLRKEGKFQAAEARWTGVESFTDDDLRRWLDKARRIQWDYKNIVKRKGRLERLY